MRNLAHLLFILTMLAAPALAGAVEQAPGARRPAEAGDGLVGFGADFAKIGGDTILMMGPWGSGAPLNGEFETPGGAPAWNGWTSVDLTAPNDSHWQVDTYNVVSGVYSAWCGDPQWPSCDVGDPDGGYGNNYRAILEWRGAVTDAAEPCTVSVAAVVNHDVEPGFDYCYLSYESAGQDIDLWIADDKAQGVVLSQQFVLYPGEYGGANGDEVVIRFRVETDGGWSDEDCYWPTGGALQLDDVVIGLSNGTGYATDFEDGTLGEFAPVLPAGTGDFAQVWALLQDVDPCLANLTPQVAFIDDGVVVPGTGGTLCLSWCYGPDGYIVNNSGGVSAAANPTLHNAIESPVMPWPDQTYGGALLGFGVYVHEALAFDSPGMFFTWGVRSTASTDPADIAQAPWRDRGLLYYGGPRYDRRDEFVADLLVPERRFVQVQLAVYEQGWIYGWSQSNGTPAPYFDNVRVAALPLHGPVVSSSVSDLAHDAFPPDGILDLVDLGANSVRFDAGRDVSARGVPTIDPGDSISLAVTSLRAGATPVGLPRLHYKLKRNELFDPYRTAGLPDEGWVEASPTYRDGEVLANTFHADLPDTGFLFPGDVLHFFLSASDEVGGVIETATMPADTTGFSDLRDPLAYVPIFKVHALPSLSERSGQPGVYDYPPVLFWDDAGARGNRDEWHGALQGSGLRPGIEYDIYYTNAPGVGMANGLGGRATVDQLAGYDDLLYTSGTMTWYTLSNGDVDQDKSRDLQVLDGWLRLGGKDAFLAGDALARDLSNDALGLAFMQDWLGVDFVAGDIRPLVDSQTSPRVMSEPGNPVLDDVSSWLANGSCWNFSSTSAGGAGYYSFFAGASSVTNARRTVHDAVVVRPGGVRLAQYADPSGAVDAYPYTAATLNPVPAFAARVISLPYDLANIWTDTDEGAKADAPRAARVRLLQDVLDFCEVPGTVIDPSDVPAAGLFSAANHPNPFNPATRISFNLPRAALLGVKVYDLRGQLVRVLADERREAGPGFVTWDGSRDGGAPAASGVYFYEVRAGAEVIVGKMALVK